jgi:uncharacterized membrane protein YraQ (UPF0718 family)
MSATAIVIDALVAVCLVISVVKSREKTWQALKVAYFASKRIAPMLLGIIAVIGLLMGFVPPKWIASVIGPGTGLLGVLAAALLGSVLMIPGIVAFPLAKSLMVMGASVMSTAAFITTLMMIGFVFIPLEIQLLGKKFCVLRNGLSFIAALIIAVIMGLVLG